MKRFTTPIIVLLAMLSFTWGCGNSNPTLPNVNGDDASSIGISDFGTGGSSGVNLPGNVSPYGDVRDLPRYVNDEVLIVLHDGVDAESVYPMAKKLGLSLVKEIRLMWGTVYRMHIDSAVPVESVVAELLAHPEVRYAEPNLIMYPCSVPYYPNDPLFEYPGDADESPWTHMYDQWGPNHLGASLVWPHGKGDSDVVIAVLDTGYRWSHEDLANQIWINEDEIPGNGIDDDDNGYIDDWRGWDAADGDNDPWDTHGHGTACAGVVGAEQDNAAGCTGIAPGVKIMAVKVSMSSGGWFVDSVIEGVQYAYDNGATAVSMSFRTYEESDIMHETFIAAWDDGMGILPIGAAGNEDIPNDCWPADWPEVLEVGATCSFYMTGQRRDTTRITLPDFYWGSNWGQNLEIMAPGSMYISTHFGSDTSYYDGGENGTFAGTSNATPCVAGGVGLLKSFNPGMSAAELRQRLKETADDIHTPGHDDQSGFGRMNVWRAIFGSDPNSDLYDVNGHFPINKDFEWVYDNIFDVSTSADYDSEDIYVLHSFVDGVMNIELEILTNGEDFDLEVYDSLEMINPVIWSKEVNNALNPGEYLNYSAVSGTSYYIRVYSPSEYNCSNYRIRARADEFKWWVDWESLAPVYVFNGAPDVPLLKLEIFTNLLITVDDIRTYVSGDIPLNLVNGFSLYDDTNESGEWEPGFDQIAASATPVYTKQLVFEDLADLCEFNNPLTYFVVADVGPSDLDYNMMFGAGLKSYKDIGIWEDAKPDRSPFPIFSDLVVLGQDKDPPVWDTTVGVQDAEPAFKSVKLFWNNATDALSEPTEYNVYFTQDDPPDIATAGVSEDIMILPGGDYDHAGKISGLENDQIYFFCVRAEDASGNEDGNLVWVSAAPNGTSDPENPELIGELNVGGPAKDVWVHDGICYVATVDSGVVIVDCTDPMQPAVLGSYDPSSNALGLQYYETQDLLYAANGTGVVILDVSEPATPVLVGQYPGYYGQDLWVSNDICYYGEYGGDFLIIDVSTPEAPSLLSELEFSSYIAFRDIVEKDGYVYIGLSFGGVQVVDASSPSEPVIIDTIMEISNCHGLDIYGDYLLATTSHHHTLIVADISDPTDITVSGGFDFGLDNQACGIAVRDSQYVFVGCTPANLFSIDWTDPAAMSIMGSFTANAASDLFYDGSYLYAAEEEHGLKIFF